MANEYKYDYEELASEDEYDYDYEYDMAVHGEFERPCLDCGAPVQRIRYADNETNYCPGCQTPGRILADRFLSRLLKDDSPRNLDEL